MHSYIKYKCTHTSSSLFIFFVIVGASSTSRLNLYIIYIVFDSSLCPYIILNVYRTEEAMSARCGVLVHCVAGVSRSVTVTLAYLMQRHRLCLRDAFELVRSRKTDIAPNFHFMRQLHSFERDLGLHERSASLPKVRTPSLSIEALLSLALSIPFLFILCCGSVFKNYIITSYMFSLT